MIRNAFDRGSLRSLTKNSPAKATGAHISIIGHITRQELLPGLTSTEAANGFGNRILWICVKRSKKLPHGGQLDEAVLDPIVERLRSAVSHAHETGRVDWSPAARVLWEEVYDYLSEGADGLFGRSPLGVRRRCCAWRSSTPYSTAAS